jgi:hypothetical protein
MKLLVLLASILALSGRSCDKKSVATSCYKGRLEIQGSCSNYTIKLLEGSLDSSVIAATWKNEYTGKLYTNVFALANPCQFPENIKEGDEFYFTIDTSKENNCIRCLIFYPTPEKALPIKVQTKPCK